MLTGTDGITITYKVLCLNTHIETGDISLVDGAILNDETGYNELNTPYDSFGNGTMLSPPAVKAMRDSGNKFAIYMSNTQTMGI